MLAGLLAFSFLSTCEDHMPSTTCSYCFMAKPCLFCGPMGFSVPGISQARILEWVAISFSEDLPNPGIEHTSAMLGGRFFTASHQGSPYYFYLLQAAL